MDLKGVWVVNHENGTRKMHRKLCVVLYIFVIRFMWSIFPFRFFTNWSIFFHMLFLCGIVGNTFTLAVFVMLCSILLTSCLEQNEPYDWRTDLSLHYTPFLIFFFTGISVDWDSFWLCWIAYILYTWGDIPQVLEWYRNPSFYFFHKCGNDFETSGKDSKLYYVKTQEDVIGLLYSADET